MIGLFLNCSVVVRAVVDSVRPVRERTPERLLEIAKETIANTGYNEISFDEFKLC